MRLGINLEFSRSENLDLASSLRCIHDAGYHFAEVYAYTPIEKDINSHLRIHTTSDYHHIDTKNDNIAVIKKGLAAFDIRLSAIDAHASLLWPEFGVPYLKRAVDLAADLDCPYVVSDEGPIPDGLLSLESAFSLVCISLDVLTKYAAERGVLFAIELHNQLTTRPDMLLRLLDRYPADSFGVNFDTGNSFLAGNDPLEHLKQVCGRVVHVHVKDIPEWQISQRGQVTGTRVGVAAGEGVVDLPGIIGVLHSSGYNGVLSVECDTLEQAYSSFRYLNQLIDPDRLARTGTG